MGTKSRATQLGNYITKVNGYDIRQKFTYKKNEKGKMQVSTSEYVICRGRKLVETGLKSKDEAIKVANSKK